MSIIVGTNSWVTIAEADTYLTTKVGSQEWFTLDDEPSDPGEESKESWLVSAYNYLINNCGYSIPSDSTDQNVKYAQIEFAYYLLRYSEEFEDRANSIAMGVTEFKASKWSEKYKGGSSSSGEGYISLPPAVRNYLCAYDGLNQTVATEIE